MGELDSAQVQTLLKGQHVGRLTCHLSDGPHVFPVKYTLGDPSHISIQAPNQERTIPHRGDSVRFEVDEIDGPGRWSTVIAWGFLEDADEQHAGGATYRVCFTDLRGFYRGQK
jgi:nitroimidazol reductase NimA-like FMN-containing flavoprotein (pyridoxamine 5'-phosphate oxidase superfamily)